jgi:TRAP-type mannitol/chloroaromatic compound transport system permease large subunit
MNIKEAKEEIKHTLLAYNRKDAAGRYTFPKLRQRPILLMGPPGIGKTAIMEQVAEECEVGLVAYTITHHTRQSAVGLPRIVTRCYNGKEVSITEYTLSEIIASVYDCMERTGKKEGILFIDEINCVSETLAPTMLQFLQNKTFGSHSVPEGWLIAAAGNPPEYNKSVREFDIVTLDRVRRMDIEADLEVWMEYAWKKEIHGSILAYLGMKKDHFYSVENTVDGKFFVTARGWEDLSEILKALLDSIWAILFPVLLIVLIRFGIMSPTESGSFACAYALLVGTVFYHELTWESLLQTLRDSVKDITVITIILAFSGVFGYGIVFDNITVTIANALLGITSNSAILLLLVVVFLLICGMFMETTVIALILTPILLPVMRSIGVNEVVFGMIMMTTVTFGVMTPPVGTALYAVSDIMECPIEETFKKGWPFYLAIVCVILFMIFFPQAVLFLPNLVYGA